MSRVERQAGEELLSVIAHGLRTPLAAIAGHAELIGARAAEASVQAGAIEISRAAERLSLAVDALLSVLEIDTARIAAEVAAVDLGQLLDFPAIADRPRLDGEDWVVYVDAERLTKALAMISASLPAEAELRMDVERRKGLLVVSFATDADWVTDNASRLALYAVGRLVELDGGSLLVRSSGLVLMLPTVEPTAAAAGCRVLIVDDDDTIRRLLRATLPEAEGFEIVEAEDGRQALELLDRGDVPDLVLLDWLMPGRSGAEVLEELRSRAPEVPVIVLTAVLANGERELAEKLGADVFLTKPFSPRQLLELVDRLLPAR